MGKVELRIQIDAELLARAQAQGIPLASFLESSLRIALASTPPGLSETGTALESSTPVERARIWALDNAESIKAYNERIARRGAFGGDLRRW